MPTCSITAFGQSDVGRVRAVNQDSLLVDTSNHLYIVADGMGGHAGGEIASKLCIEQVIEYLIPKEVSTDPENDGLHPDRRVQSILGEAINHASSKIYERALEEPSLKGMGTTATILKLIGRHGYFAHVGDTRLYLVRSGFIYQLTYDHSLVSEQVRAGLLTQEEADAHHLRNVITRSVGYQEEEDVDTAYVKLEDDDIIILCSDGLHGKVTNREIAQITKAHEIDSVIKLIELANERGGDDNISLVVLKIQVSQ